MLVRAEELFRAGVGDDTPLHFWPLALANTNLDGEIDLAELEVVQAPDDALNGVAFDDPDSPQTGVDGQPITLSDLIYDQLLPRVARVRDSGQCRTELRGQRR